MTQLIMNDAVMDDITQDGLLNEVKHYWNNRAEGYNEVNVAELAGGKRRLWQEIILRHAPKKSLLNILDVGAGPGFFAITLAMAGHRVTAVDATPAMLAQAKNNADVYGVDIAFVAADVHTLPFPDNHFDVLVTRNVTWNLKQPLAAYQEWRRVLAPGGRLINFDANWYAHLFNAEARDGYLRDRQNARRLKMNDHYANTDTVAMENIARALPLSREIRPAWDRHTLLGCGFNQIFIDENIADNLWDDEEKINYASTPMFMVVAEK
ncbi:putative methyltransferase YcgJ [Dickeya dianthicola]|uniref:Class I SAM-dependent methyltransferase n=1 Tax=Dickeya dianthicola TaxID=204039 RepID=A0AAP6VGE6_9GAMM|nr:class I SAM-dependent methyltransferase [Dickeya dianthicola]ATO32574.1 SmtA protein [Dickeya dianthicola RNS04.9]AYC18580.1 putative methyltransferase YcgJ [Dickeya dianthicola]MBI0439075.1 class I SAM-dependent methyltransferase [Dickeya dianthicola]MBI0450325.1 class I SAM-dependent methyltransferase [Dickeya dianthicola]MBI0454957.1 class I SAM-dependent methyltransferase [Dickeya dianthicola]